MSFPEEMDKRESLPGSLLPFYLPISICNSPFWNCWGSRVLKWAWVIEMNPDAELSSPSHFYGQFAFCEQKQTGVCPSGRRCWHWFPLVPLEWMFWGDFFWPVFFTQGFTNYFWSLMIIEKLHWSKSPSILFCPRGSCGYLDISVSLCPLVTSPSWSLMDTNTGNITCVTQTFPGI